MENKTLFSTREIARFLNINEKMVNYFIQSCDILSSFFKENILGYGIVTACKKEKS